MGELILVGIFILIYAIYKANLNSRIDNHPVDNIDTLKMTHDMNNGVSQAERRRRYADGYYDKK